MAFKGNLQHALKCIRPFRRCTNIPVCWFWGKNSAAALFESWIQNGGVPGTFWTRFSLRFLLVFFFTATFEQSRIDFRVAVCPQLYLRWRFGGLRSSGATGAAWRPARQDHFLVSDSLKFFFSVTSLPSKDLIRTLIATGCYWKSV